MIRLTRDRSTASVHSSFRGVGRQRLAALLLHKPGTKLNFEEKLRKWKPAKQQLNAECFGKCAYCEAPTDNVVKGDVEHFRPKAEYWWLAYCYDNYLFACNICNQIHKKDNFPIEGQLLKSPAFLETDSAAVFVQSVCRSSPDPCDDTLGLKQAEFAALLKAERALLLNPYTEDPARHFAWKADDNEKIVELAPASTRSKKYFQAAVDFYGLNRVELCRLRYRFYSALDVFVLALGDPGLSAPVRQRTEVQVARMLADDAPFAGMVRYFVRKVWKLQF